MTGKITVEVGPDGVAVVAINNPPLNLLSSNVMLSLKQNIEEALSRDDVKAIVITGVDGKFCAGFDVTAFGGTRGKKTRKELGFMSIEFVTDTLEAARKPVVVAIEGPAFGGGLEIALACHARIVSASAKLGLTELQYGILPGLGGTQRLPRLVGLPRALEMILMSKQVGAEEARSMSLVDAIAPATELLHVARQWALDILECRRPLVISLYKADKLEPLKEARAILKSARLEFQRKNPNVIHPLVCINVIEQGIVSGPRNALWKEAEALEELRQSSTCKSLVHFFFAQRNVLKSPGISKMHLLPRKIEKVAIVGGGPTSSEMATILLLRNYQVILKEKSEKLLSCEINRIKGNLQNHANNGKATEETLIKAFGRLKGVLDYENFKDVDLVIEAESESLSLKQEVFAILEKCCHRHCIFTSTSLTFDLKLIGERTECQNRIARINFYCLPPVVPLMEIAHTRSTLPQVIVDLIAFGRKLNKTPIVVDDRKGYSVSSLLVTYLHAAILLAEQGVDVYQIDQSLISFGMQLGPFRMIDMFGLQAFAAISKIIVENSPYCSYKPKLISILQQNVSEGERNGKVFYKYDNGSKVSPDPAINTYIINTMNVSNVTSNSELRKLSNSEVAEMILFPALNQACRMVSEGVVTRPSDLDVASVLVMGFPAYRGGLFYWSDSFGSNYICSMLEKWSKEYGDFYKPCAYIMDRAMKRISLVNETKQTKSKL